MEEVLVIMSLAFCISVLGLLVACANAVTNERLRRINDFRLAWDLKIWREGHKTVCACGVQTEETENIV